MIRKIFYILFSSDDLPAQRAGLDISRQITLSGKEENLKVQMRLH